MVGLMVGVEADTYVQIDSMQARVLFFIKCELMRSLALLKFR